jgi:hypothetical protein
MPTLTLDGSASALIDRALAGYRALLTELN